LCWFRSDAAAAPAGQRWLNPEFVADGSLAEAVKAAADDTLEAAHEALAVESKAGADDSVPAHGDAKPQQQHSQAQQPPRLAEEPKHASAPPPHAHDHAAPRPVNTLRQMERGLLHFKAKLQARLLELEAKAQHKEQKQQQKQAAAGDALLETQAQAQALVKGGGDQQAEPEPQSDDGAAGIMPRRYRATDIRVRWLVLRDPVRNLTRVALPVLTDRRLARRGRATKTSTRPRPTRCTPMLLIPTCRGLC
jgi:hypothetical protein